MSRSGFHRLLPSSARKTEPLLLLRMVGELATSAHFAPYWPIVCPLNLIKERVALRWEVTRRRFTIARLGAP
jgi:hypothetical protein